MVTSRDENKKDKITELVYREELPQIVTETRRIDASGHVIESEYISVKSHTLESARKIHKEIKEGG